MDSKISPAAIRKVTRELYSIHNDPPEGIRLILNEDSIDDIQAWILGPEGTPYEGGCFRVRIQLVPDFPNSPPICNFLTKIFHPNVSAQGDVCVSTLKKDWKRDLGIKHILLVVKCLLIVPNPESALNEEAGRQLLERYDDYAKHARLMTDIHARTHRKEIFPITQAPLSMGPVYCDSAIENASTTSVATTDADDARSQEPRDCNEMVTEVLPVRDGLSEKKKQVGIGGATTHNHLLAATKPMSTSLSSISPSTSPQSSSATASSVPGCTSTLALLPNENGHLPCSSRSYRKRKFSTDEQSQQGCAAASVTIHKASDTLLATAGTAAASQNHTHVPICPHSSSKLSLQENQASSRNRPPVPGRVLVGLEGERDAGGWTLPDWPTTTLTGLAASRSLVSSPLVTTSLDYDKKRSLRRL
ncbi:hypothetical protein BGZ73_008873 [Actinomortierella ambigua]|nr:hypothetical protein BGZ73_008873 [Actinomortierella ambigua]